MLYRFAADAIVVFHFCFVGFVHLGGLAVLRWPRLMYVHLPAAAWGAFVEFSGWLCPLTPYENRLRAMGHQPGYTGSFVDHYIMPVLYPNGLTRSMQIQIGCIVLALNLTAYFLLILKLRRRNTPSSAPVEASTP